MLRCGCAHHIYHSAHLQCGVKRLKQSRVAEWLEQALHGASCERFGTDRFILIGRDEDEQDGRDNYVVFVPDTPQTAKGRVLLATKTQLRIIPSVTANQIDASLKKIGKGLLTELGLAGLQL